MYEPSRCVVQLNPYNNIRMSWDLGKGCKNNCLVLLQFFIFDKLLLLSMKVGSNGTKPSETNRHEYLFTDDL